MTVDPALIPGLLLLAAELGVLAAVGFVVARVALRQADDRMALAQGLVVGPALWGLIVNVVMYAVPGLAGALVGWMITLALGAGLAWRASHPIRPRPRVLAGFAVSALALFWVALASRQLLGIVDPPIHLGMAASLRAGGFPPELPWNPGMAAPYHYGIDLLIGLLAPPVGPDLAFVTEILGAYAWTSFALVVVTALLRRASGFAVLVTAPLLLTAAAWTVVFATPSGVVQIPVPAGVPAAGLRASLTDIYAPFIQLPLTDGRFIGLADIWKPALTLSYALVFVVLEHAARAGRRSWLDALTLAGLVGFAGLLSASLAPLMLVGWAGLDAARLGKSLRAGSVPREALLRSGVGLVLAVLLLGVGGGMLANTLDGAGPSVFSLAWLDDPGSRRLLASFDSWPGGIGVLGLGPVVVAGAAVLLAGRDRLVLTLAAGVAVLVLARLVVRYEPFPGDIVRLDGHARNLALLALLLALSACLTGLRPVRWRYAAGALLTLLVTWPTVAEPVRNLALAIGRGVEVTNTQSVQRERDERYPGRDRFAHSPSDGLVAYIRDHAAVDARVLSPYPDAISSATGRPNASGFAQHQHLFPVVGPSYRDAIEHLEPAATRRLGIAYVHATDAWVAGLPDRAARWLADPGLFDLLTRDGAETLYGVRPEFLRLDPVPAPASFEALRQAVPPATTVYLSPTLEQEGSLRAASALSHARLLGAANPWPVHPGLEFSLATPYARRSGFIEPGPLHLLTPWPAEPLGEQVPDLVITPVHFVPWMFPSAGRQPIWWNEEVAVYAPHSAVAPIRPPPSQKRPPDVNVRVSDVRVADGRIAFTTTLHDQAPEQWTGQDWVLIAGDRSPWSFPLARHPDGPSPATDAWFAGQMVAGKGVTTHAYALDPRAPSLVVRGADGSYTAVPSSTGRLGSGAWTLALRLSRDQDRGSYVAKEEAAFIPVMQIEISEAGDVSAHVYDQVHGGLLP